MYTSLSDAELAKRCQQEDRAAQRTLFNKYGPTLLSVCRRYAPDAMEADDYHQLGWIRAFSKIKSYAGDGSLEGWLRRLFVNVCLNQVAARKRKDQWIVPLPNEDETDIPHVPPPADFLAQEVLLKAINTLPDGARLVFNLHAIEGYNHIEIADLLQISESTSRVQLLRARRLLASRLGLVKSEKTQHTKTPNSIPL